MWISELLENILKIWDLHLIFKVFKTRQSDIHNTG